MNLLIAGADLTSSAVAFVILFGVMASNYKKEKKFFYLTVSALALAVFCCVDCLSYLMDEFGGNELLHTLMNALTFAGVDIILPSFVYYIWEVINEKTAVSRIHTKVVTVGCCIDLCAILYGTVTGQLFRFENGETIYGGLYYFVCYMQLCLNFYCGVQVWMRRTTLNGKIVRTVVMYFLVPCVMAILEAMVPGLALGYAAVTVVFVVVYMVIASEEIQAGVLGEKLMHLASVTDNLTGLANRRAYEEDAAALRKQTAPADFVYVSMDVNGLKLVNDTLGHSAGDELIAGAAQCMRQCFGAYGKIYRTGGDEFIALLYISKQQFKHVQEDFENVFTAWRGREVDKLSISYGFVTAAEAQDMTFHEMTLLADKRMYEDKSAYYRQKGVDRRGQKEAHVALCELYTKILKINITTDTYQIINMDPSEQTKEKGFAPSISEWFSKFGKSGQVHPDDLEDYLSKTTLEYMREYFCRDKTSLSIFYRRKYLEGYKRVMMEIIPASDYARDNQSLFLYVKSIDK